MPDLRRILADHDLAFLRQAAALWGHELTAASQRDAADELAAWLLDPEQVTTPHSGATRLADDLPPAARAALESLARDGRQPLPQFTRRHGEIRAMGPARREREKPWANDPSTTETLWYRALIGRAFFDDGRGPEEFIFIPDDLKALVWVGPAGGGRAEPPGRPWEPAGDEGRWTKDEGPAGDEGRWTKDEGPAGDEGRWTKDEGPAGDEGRWTKDEGPAGDEGRWTKDEGPAGDEGRWTKDEGPAGDEGRWTKDEGPAGDEGRWTKDEGPAGDEGRWTKDEGPATEYLEPTTDDRRPTTAGHATPDTRHLTLDTRHLTHGFLAAHDAVTLLAYLHVNTVKPADPAAPAAPSLTHLPLTHTHTLTQHLLQPSALPLYLHLIQQLGLAEAAPGQPFKLDPEQTQPFLQAAPQERLRQLAEAWRDARDWNDLLHVPGLVFEGTAWRNDPLTARQAILGLLAQVPAETWWDAAAFVRAVQERQPDFQRPAGDYDSWYIRDPGGQYLRGFANWDRVDGALVRWLIACPLRWLGLVEVSDGDPPAGFRLTRPGAALLGQTGWEAADPAETPVLDLSAAGELRVPAAASAHDRFQAARISQWLPPERGPASPVYVYRLTPAALSRARGKGITPARILQFLERAAPSHPALPGLAAALLRWERSGAEAALHDTLLLKLADPALLDTLRRVPHLRDWLGPALGPGLVAVRREHAAEVRAALAELGLLLDGD